MDRIRLGFLIAEHTVTQIKADQIQHLLTKNFVHAIVRQLSSGANSKRTAKDAAEGKEKASATAAIVTLVKRVLHGLTTLAKTDASAALALATALQGTLCPSRSLLFSSLLPFVLAMMTTARVIHNDWLFCYDGI
jgi:hypothetical protein